MTVAFTPFPAPKMFPLSRLFNSDSSPTVPPETVTFVIPTVSFPMEFEILRPYAYVIKLVSLFKGIGVMVGDISIST